MAFSLLLACWSRRQQEERKKEKNVCLEVSVLWFVFPFDWNNVTIYSIFSSRVRRRRRVNVIGWKPVAVLFVKLLHYLILQIRACEKSTQAANKSRHREKSENRIFFAELVLVGRCIMHIYLSGTSIIIAPSRLQQIFAIGEWWMCLCDVNTIGK